MRHSLPLSVCIIDHAHRRNMPHVGCMPRAALGVEVECTRNYCSRRSARLAAEGVSQVSSEVYGCCMTVEQMEWEAVAAVG